MKLEPVLEKDLRMKMDPRKPVFFTRVKMFFLVTESNWVENCRGTLVLYQYDGSSYFTIINIVNYQINFDMEIYSNFLNYSRFIGDTCAMVFILPTNSKEMQVMMVLESKEELMGLKRALEKELIKGDSEQELSFFRQEEIKELIQKAQIEDDLLESNLRFRNEVETEIRGYLKQIDEMERKGSKNGFKSYGLGREEWKLDEDEKKFLKEKKKEDTISLLVRLRKQAKLA